MKIVHIAPNSPYNDYWGYQENLLPKYQKKMGHTVTMITTNTMHKEGIIIETGCDDYVLEDGVRVIRLAVKQYPWHLLTSLFSKLDVFLLLQELSPDFIFFHGLVSTTMFDVIKYKKKCNSQCVVVQDNHLDYYNIGNRFDTLKEKMVRAYYRWLNSRFSPYVDRVYGVTPWRRRFAEDYFKVNSQKTDVLIMGADDEKINFTHRDAIRARIRREYGLTAEDFVIVTGGKIDKNKRIDLLMEACAGLDGVKLLVFGQVLDDVKERFDALLQENANIAYVGWVSADRVYDYFFAADLAFFPGTHSVLWEQACASKTPCIFEKWDGMQHVDNGGNGDFIENVTAESIRNKIEELRFTKAYEYMKRVARSDKTDIYLYSRIAEKSLECVV